MDILLSLLTSFTIKDYLIVVTLIILLLCIQEINRLKKTIAEGLKKRLLAQLAIAIDDKAFCFYITNESFFLAQNISIEETLVNLDDFGFNVGVLLVFEPIEVLKPHEKKQLAFKVLDKNRFPLPELTDKIIPHLLGITFPLKASFTNIEGMKFSVLFIKKREKFFVEKTEFLS
jgi:hypothetical protein